MIAYWLKRLMWILGYRRVLWLPSEKGLSLADFWTWEYMPWADKRDYTEHDYRRADNCGCDWLDNGLNPIGCPYCKLSAETEALRELLLNERAALLDECHALLAENALLRQAAHPAITHCDNCGCDWLDNGLNPIGCPYCELRREVERRWEGI